MAENEVQEDGWEWIGGYYRYSQNTVITTEKNTNK